MQVVKPIFDDIVYRAAEETVYFVKVVGMHFYGFKIFIPIKMYFKILFGHLLGRFPLCGVPLFHVYIIL